MDNLLSNLTKSISTGMGNVGNLLSNMMPSASRSYVYDPVKMAKMGQSDMSQMAPQYRPSLVASVAPQPMASPMLSAPQAQAPAPQVRIDPRVVQAATPIFQQYGIPLAVGFGQMAQEGRAAHKYAQAPYNNPMNLGAYDRNPDGAFQYPTLEKGIEAYAKLLSGKYEMGRIGSGKFDKRYESAYAARNDPRKMVEEIARVGYASDQNYIDGILNTPEYQHFLNGGQ